MRKKLYGYVKITDKKPKYEAYTYTELMNMSIRDHRGIALVSEKPINPYIEERLGNEDKVE